MICPIFTSITQLDMEQYTQYLEYSEQYEAMEENEAESLVKHTRQYIARDRELAEDKFSPILHENLKNENVYFGISTASDEFPLPEDFSTASEGMFHLLRKRDATAEEVCTANEDKAPQDDASTGSTSEGSAKKKGRTVAVTTEDMQKRRNDVKSRATLLLALPDEHQLRFSKYNTAQELWAAILKIFGGNEATKKTKKNQLKQQYGNFKAEGTETPEQTFNRMQAIVSHLEFMDVEIKQDDLNQKFLTSLAPEWLMYTIVWRSKSDLDTMSLDDVYNHLKVYESEVQKKSESNSQNMAFISSAKNSSGNREVNTASIPTASTQVFPAGPNVATAIISLDTACAYIASQSNGSQIKYEDINQIDEDDIEEIDIKWNMALLSMKADRFWKKTGKKISIQGTDVAGITTTRILELMGIHIMKMLLNNSSLAPLGRILVMVDGEPVINVNLPFDQGVDQNCGDNELDELLYGFQCLSQDTMSRPYNGGGKRRSKCKKKNLMGCGNSGSQPLIPSNNTEGLIPNDMAMKLIGKKRGFSYAPASVNKFHWCFWWNPYFLDARIFSKENSYIDRNYVGVTGNWLGVSTKIGLFNVYALQYGRLKEELWLSIETLVNSVEAIWIIFEDFNTVMFREEKMGCNFDDGEANKFNDFISRVGLFDFLLGDRRFTRFGKNRNKSEHGGENQTVEQVRKRAKWDNDDYVYRGLILNGMSDSLFDIYQNVETSKDLWDTLEAKYMAEDALSKKFLLGSHLRIEESFRVHDSDKPKGNNVAGPSVVNMVEHNNSSRHNDNKGKRKHHDTRANPKKKPKVTCWKCGKPRHLKKDCKAGNVGNKANGSSTKGSVDGSANSLKGQTFMSTSKLNDSILWHARLGYVHFKRMQDMSKDGLIPAIDTDTGKYKTCMLNKITKKPFQNVKHETKVLELIHSDLCDLHATPSLGNKKYFVTFIDDAYRFCYVYLLHSKDEALDKFKVFKTEVELQQESLIKRFRTDMGGEYMDTMASVRLPDPKVKTFGERGIECIFVGYVEHSNAFRFYVIEPNDAVAINSIIESRDAIFDEQRTLKDFRLEFQLYLIEGTRDDVSGQHCYCFNVEDDTKTFDEAMKSQDAPKQWHQKFHEVDLSNGYLLNQADKCVYSKIDASGHERADVILGIWIKHESNGIAISQSHYIEKVLKKFNYSDCTPVSTPLDTYEKLMPNKVWLYTSNPRTLALASYSDGAEQTCITGSIMEFEFLALTAAGKEAGWLKNLLLEIPLWVKPITPISIRCDSAATLAKAYS
nr:zinc finger, CCHC-type [Tanacetum cinerariifolium]